MNRKWKWLVSPTVTFAVLFSTVCTAVAAESLGPDIQPIITADTESETEEENLPESPKDESPLEPENPEDTSSVEFTPDVHEHNWSVDWNYDESWHWHECNSEGCPVTDNSGKDGYTEHSYGDDNVCTECGYYEPAVQLARAAEGVVPTFQEAYEAMIALQEKYPEGMEWTNFTPYGSNGPFGDSYTWNGGSIYGANRGVGCAAFVFLLSDAAFGSLPARAIENGRFTFEDVKVGDILRVNGNSHSVIVLQKSTAGVIIAEANYNKSVHWGRVMNESEVLSANYIITRYPEGYVPPEDPGANEVAQSGTAGNLNWSLTNAGILTISGSGVIPDYASDNLPPWNGQNVSTVIIENGVTGIGDYAFYQSAALSVYIPDGITKIGQDAFHGSKLLSATVPGKVETIGDNAFRDCANLTSVTVSEGVKAIGDNAFRGCTSLTHIDFPASITSVGAGAFMSCQKMTRVRFMPGTGTVTIGDGLFAQCWNLTSVTLPQTAERISADMFSSCTMLPELYIPTSVKEIGENPFTSCGALKNIYFGGSEAEWNAMASPALKGSLQSTNTTVIFNAVFEDPFAPDPNDPGDLPPDENEGGEDPVEPGDDEDDSQPGDDENTTQPDDDENTTQPGDDENTTQPGDDEDTPQPGDNENTTQPDDNNSDSDDDENETGNIPSAGSTDNSIDSPGNSARPVSTSGLSNRNGQNESKENSSEASPSANLPASSEMSPGSESEPADTESQSPQDPDEIETTQGELPEIDVIENQETGGEEAETESNSKSDKTGIGIIIPVLSVTVAAALAGAFVFIRKKNLWKK